MCKIARYKLPCRHVKYTHTLSCNWPHCNPTYDDLQLDMNITCNQCAMFDREALALEYGIFDDERLDWIIGGSDNSEETLKVGEWRRL
jgi:hypothetical protein